MNINTISINCIIASIICKILYLNYAHIFAERSLKMDSFIYDIMVSIVIWTRNQGWIFEELKANKTDSNLWVEDP